MVDALEQSDRCADQRREDDGKRHVPVQVHARDGDARRGQTTDTRGRKVDLRQ